MLSQILLTLLKNPLGLATVASPFIVNHINSEKAKLAAQAARRESELKQATGIAGEVGNAMDNLAYLTRQAMYGVVFRKLSTPEDQAMWKAYQEALMKWESTKSTTLAHMEMYFGADNAATLKKIQSDFKVLESQVDAAFYERTTSKWYIDDKEGGEHDFRKKHFPVWNRLMDDMTELSKEMIRQIQYEEVGSLRHGANLIRS